ncbi:uncharacterized protein CANTADRAFT_24852 [Suhomyces tanzawaensis NRRL Y-17324]|uniref:Uncharacterized protein n=1 Tax=Suhomyces tanzawaensis NRRL Y-17324 TaxID=984487 RepID=A0A1E4SRX0_9ASCO|nr:uncharacterized protein CANTADRAFT_24852 [Suhomyces tanzawaensis NRRL Y-17324]ODV82263.1 hypothetical protein CANTADRAFT_24852 [Suhomyces tanzawaensis NRRL Y-17324]
MIPKKKGIPKGYTIEIKLPQEKEVEAATQFGYYVLSNTIYQHSRRIFSKLTLFLNALY